MKLWLSKLYATIIAEYYGGILNLHSINSKGYWEFTVNSEFHDEPPLYKSKGLR